MLPYEHGGDIYTNKNICADHSININPLGMPEGARHAIAAQTDAYERYPDPQCRELSAAIAARHKVDAGMVLCGNGAAELLFRLGACLKVKDALSIAPSFFEYARAVTLFGGRMREHALHEEEGFALSGRILEEIGGAQLFFLCNPNNPTGRLADPKLVCRIADVCAKAGTLLLIDECFMDFTDGTSMTERLCDYPNMIILRAFTKIYAMAGVRLGYMLGADRELLSRVAEYGAVWNVSGVAQVAGRAALCETGWMERTRELVRKERAYLTRELKRLGLFVFISDANFLLIKSEAPLYERLKARGILVRACGNFTGLGERFIRIGIKRHDQNEALVHAIKEALDG